MAGALLLALLVSAPPSSRSATSSSRSATPSGSALLAPASNPPVPAPAYYRPVIAGGKAFPVARSNFLSLVVIQDNWHAVRLRLVGGRWQPVGVHEGIDISAERGDPVLDVAPGRVEAVGWTFYSGTRVGVRGDDGRYYFYAHLSWVAPAVREGARVAAGDVLGRVGNTGYGPPGERDRFPPHLHFGLQAGSSWISPYPMLVSLYRATVASNRRAQAALDRLAAAGRRVAWHRAAGRLYTTFGLGLVPAPSDSGG